MSEPAHVKCQVFWVDCNGKDTPDENPAVAIATLKSTGQKLAVCAEHLKVLKHSQSHFGKCPHKDENYDHWAWSYIHKE